MLAQIRKPHQFPSAVYPQLYEGKRLTFVRELFALCLLDESVTNVPADLHFAPEWNMLPIALSDDALARITDDKVLLRGFQVYLFLLRDWYADPSQDSEFFFHEAWLGYCKRQNLDLGEPQLTQQQAALELEYWERRNSDILGELFQKEMLLYFDNGLGEALRYEVDRTLKTPEMMMFHAFPVVDLPGDQYMRFCPRFGGMAYTWYYFDHYRPFLYVPRPETFEIEKMQPFSMFSFWGAYLNYCATRTAFATHSQGRSYNNIFRWYFSSYDLLPVRLTPQQIDLDLPDTTVRQLFDVFITQFTKADAIPGPDGKTLIKGIPVDAMLEKENFRLSRLMKNLLRHRQRGLSDMDNEYQTDLTKLFSPHQRERLQEVEDKFTRYLESIVNAGAEATEDKPKPAVELDLTSSPIPLPAKGKTAHGRIQRVLQYVKDRSAVDPAFKAYALNTGDKELCETLFKIIGWKVDFNSYNKAKNRDLKDDNKKQQNH